MTGVNMGQYIPAGSAVHRIDPRAKLFIALLSVIAVFLTSDVPSLIIVSFWGLLAVGLSGIKPDIYYKSLKPFWVLITISFFLQVLFTPGELLWNMWFIKITREGLANGVWLVWRLSMLVLLPAIVTFTTTPLRLTAALEEILLPLVRFGVPVREMAMIINISLRFIPTLFEEAKFLATAQWSRGASFTRGSIASRVRGLVPLIVPLIINIYRRADELALSMENRCYQVGAKRSRMTEFKFKLNDYLALLLTSVVFFVGLFSKL